MPVLSIYRIGSSASEGVARINGIAADVREDVPFQTVEDFFGMSGCPGILRGSGKTCLDYTHKSTPRKRWLIVYGYGL